MKNGQFPEIIQLADLNGKNGFKLDGENNNDLSGFSVSAAGDINGDGYNDVLIGAVWYPSGNHIGRSYVVFGGPGVGKRGVLPLSSLNGSNGFKLDGENNNDYSGSSAAGDINSDGYNDLVIGANWWDSARGRSYVVFGGPGVGKTGELPLSSLNGANGFKLDGENNGDFSGQSLSAAGDINGDGHVDLLMGAHRHASGGRSYVVFGGPGVGKTGGLPLFSLNGSNGFKLDSENNGDWNGWSVRMLGDINGDGYDDLLTGAFGYPADSRKGRSYVVFGGPEVGNSGNIALGSLNGVNGLKLDGENNGDCSGISVSAAGDINGDGHNDLLIGALGYPAGNNKGRSYVVFGGPGVGQSGNLLLSSLNGANGFKLDGESNGDFSGQSVSAAGDINGDGYADLLIGARGYPSGSGAQGRSYVVFGGPGVGQSGELLLSSLNGANGFKLDGANNRNVDESGYFVSAAGDINGDGVDDVLIGDYEYPNGANKGCSYVVFGDVPPVLVNNSLNIFSGGVAFFKASNLAAYDRNHDNSTLVFIPTNMTHGQFELTNNPGVMLNNFTQQQIWDQQIQFVHDGSSEAPAYNITVHSEGIAWTGPVAANITFNTNNFLILENNQLIINQGQAVVLTPDNLKATNQGDVQGNLTFTVSNLVHGKFEFLSAPNQSVLIFRQQNITDGVVRFVHDNSPSAPGYRVAVSNGTLTTSAQPAVIDFDAEPILVRNALTIRAGQTVTLTVSNLYATHNGIADPNLMFIITDVQNGFFNISNSQSNQIASQENITFLQQQVMDRVILFSQQGPGLSLPAYRIAVSDGRVTTSPVSAAVTLQQGQFPEIIQLADLNGKNGFKLDGENNNDYSGFSVSAAGDINGDGHADLVIGAVWYPSGNHIGRSYVVFGGPGVGKTGGLPLSSLNGSNGFKLDGENNNDYSGISVSAAGDINGDGHDDVLIGANWWDSSRGRSYVVFGGPTVGSSGLIALASLNGANGFKLDGENNHDWSGCCSAVGDINADGYADLLIGAPGYPSDSGMGRSYVVYGGPGVGNSGDIALGSLNGTNGFKLDGENDGDRSGGPVNIVGDINGDGYVDLLIGAPLYPSDSGKGRSYVVFGGPGVGQSGGLLLSSLNGANGFKLDGENNNDWSGISVSPAGDINDDGHNDLLIGARGYPGGSGNGRSYVVFGGPGVGQSGDLLLSSLNGANGFKLDGENNGDFSGQSLSAAGDINGDGYADLLIGAHGYPSGSGAQGRSYVVFGGPGVGQNGALLLSSLNGANGFKLDGENNSNMEVNGRFVSAAGDINGDGVDDVLIGAYEYPNGANKGCSYVVFGDAPPVLINNSLNIFSGGVVFFKASNLAAYDRNHDNSTLVFIPTNMTHGQFELTNNPGVMLNNFTQQQIWDGNIQFVHDGSSEAPAYNITVRSEGIAWTGPIAANITFFDNFVLETNQLIINQGQSVILTSTNLKATNRGEADESLSFLISDLVHGQFEFLSTPNQSILIFQQQNITDGVVRFIHDDTKSAPGYRVAVSNGTLTSPAQSAVIDFDANPVIVNNRLVINQGQSVRLTSAVLSATHPGKTDENNLQFDISGVQQGQFNWISFPSTPITSFYQQNITDGRVQFTQDNSLLAPSYTVSVTDGRTRSLSQAAQIDFDTTPIVLNNSLRINQGETVGITGEMLSATHLTADDSTLLFNITGINHGQFSWVESSDHSITLFYQQNITTKKVQFVHDDSSFAPMYQVTVTDGRAYSTPQAALIDFDAIPVLLNNSLRINQGETVLITSNILSAVHPTGEDNSLLFNLTGIMNGRFCWRNNPFTSLESFYQNNISNSLIQFTHDNSTHAPAYQVLVTDGRTASPFQSAKIDFDASPILLNNTLIIDQGQTVRFTSAFLSATHPGGDDKLLLFNISQITHGKFSLTAFPNQNITSFYQKNMTDSLIQFSHDNSTQAPGYFVSVSDGRITLPPVAADIDFDESPILEVNQLVINQGQTVVLSENNLRATHAGSIEGNLELMITDVQQGQFSWTENSKQPITQFLQQNITGRQVQFTHNNLTLAPAYRVSVSDGRITTAPVSSQIDFDVMPLLIHNQLTIGQGQSVTLTSANLFATHNGIAEPTLIFQITHIQNGAFLLTLQSATALTGNVTFLQQDVSGNKVIFYQQGDDAPSYQVGVTDGRIATNPQPATVTFFWKPILARNQFLASRGQVTVLTTDNIAATRNGTAAKDLQFVVTGTVQHGRFEQRSTPGSVITSFYQQDVLQQAIQFAHDNSTAAPQYSLLVRDNQSGLSSDTQAGQTLLVLNNNFPVNQGQVLKVTESVLNATGIQPQDSGNIVFTPIVGTLQHGYFALTTSPNYPLTSFQQHQITSNEIIFVPDNSTTAPSGYLTVNDGQTSGAQGTIACQIDFDMAPILKNAYLKTSVGERVKITDVNLKATSQTSAVNNLVFEIGEPSHGYFADNDEWQNPLNNFTQQRITHGDIIFVTDESGQSPHFKVSVWDGRLHCVGCPQPAEIVFSGDGGGSGDGSLSSTIKSSLIGALVSGGVGLLFFALKWYLNYKHQLNLQRTARPTIDGEAQDLYSDALLLPIAREIFSRIKIGGCLGYVGQEQYNEYVGAVSVIVAALETRQVFRPDQWNSVMTRPQKQKIIDAIATHTKELVGNNRCCSTRTFTSFYRAEATPKMIREQAEAIADAVQETLSNRAEAKGSHSRRNLRLTRTNASLNESQIRTPLLQ